MKILLTMYAITKRLRVPFSMHACNKHEYPRVRAV